MASLPQASTVSATGLGYRAAFAEALLSMHAPPVPWLEIHPENYIRRGGRYARLFDRAAERFPLVPHGLTTCFGNPEPPGAAWLRDLRALCERIGAPWFSDHLCFSAAGGAHAHDLLPVPRTTQMAREVADRICRTRDALGIPVAVENVSFYGHPPGSEGASDAAFITEVVERADALLLLDVNNVVVNARNFGYDAGAYVDDLPLERVVQIHIAGHTRRSDGLRIDTHDRPVDAETTALLGRVLAKTGRVPVLLERDGRYPPLEALLSELADIQAVVDRALHVDQAETPPRTGADAAR